MPGDDSLFGAVETRPCWWKWVPGSPGAGASPESLPFVHCPCACANARAWPSRLGNEKRMSRRYAWSDHADYAQPSPPSIRTSRPGYRQCTRIGAALQPTISATPESANSAEHRHRHKEEATLRREKSQAREAARTWPHQCRAGPLRWPRRRKAPAAAKRWIWADRADRSAMCSSEYYGIDNRSELDRIARSARVGLGS